MSILRAIFYIKHFWISLTLVIDLFGPFSCPYTPIFSLYIMPSILSNFSVFEIMPMFAKNIICGFARMDGRTVGVRCIRQNCQKLLMHAILFSDFPLFCILLFVFYFFVFYFFVFYFFVFYFFVFFCTMICRLLICCFELCWIVLYFLCFHSEIEDEANFLHSSYTFIKLCTYLYLFATL